MIHTKKIVLFIAFYFTVACCIGQKNKNESGVNKYRSVNWGLDEGLSTGGVNAIIKDVNGFLWIATPFGLNRFDGSTFKIYTADTTKKNKTIPGNYISTLIEDSDRNIWISTNKGLSCYYTKADTFRNTFANLPNNIFPFWATYNEILCWNDAEHELTGYNIHSGTRRTLTKISTSDSLEYGVSPQYTIFDSASNSIWSPRGYHGNGGGLGGVLQISLTNGKRTQFNWDCYKKIPDHSHVSEGMRYDRKRNSIWISSNDGLVEFRLNDKSFHHIDAMNEFVNVKDFWQWAGIDIDEHGRVWTCSRPTGIMIYDPADNSAQLPFPHDSVQQQNTADNNLYLYCDKEGMAWTGGFSGKGVYQVIPFSPTLKRYVKGDGQANGLSNSAVFNFVNAGQGNVWMGTPDGINIFNPRTSAFNLIRLKDLSGITGPGDDLMPLNVDTTGKKAWIYHGGVYYAMDIASGKCSLVLYEDSNGKKSSIDSVIANHPQNKFPVSVKNTLFIVTSFPDHQEILEVNGAIAKKILSLPDGTIYTGDFYSICSNNDNLFFLKRQNASTNLTYALRNDNWICTPTPFDSIQWNRIYYNKKDQTYWIIVETQLIQCDKNFRKIHTYTTDDGMPGVQVYDLVPDNKGNVWFITERAIFQLNTKTKTTAMLSEKDGFLPQSFGWILFCTKDDDGDIYTNGDPGFNRISPDKYVSSSSSVYFESLKINQKSFPLSTGINNLHELSLRYFENSISIETGTLDYYSKSKTKIRYKLESEGKTVDWQYAPGHTTITFTQLQPGKYRLILQASNSSNEFTGPEKILLINISPAFWNTWWFRIITITVIAALFYGLIRWRLQQRFRLQLERSEKEKQIADIKQKATELEMQALRAQMNPHFIFNSLNSINRFILQNNKLQASEYLTKFSRLVRLILQNSQASLITLESELESLELYMNLEAVRFNDHFEYKISYPKDLDIEVLKVPPLILQPYVENAIWHGLMHKEEKGRLDVEIAEAGNHLFLKITDNGIGRKKASEISAKSNKSHKSMGLRITANRIAMMQQSGEDESPVKINDLLNDDGTAAGTQVVIRMPVVTAE